MDGVWAVVQGIVAKMAHPSRWEGERPPIAPRAPITF
jgi:hypothetical protein